MWPTCATNWPTTRDRGRSSRPSAASAIAFRRQPPPGARMPDESVGWHPRKWWAGLGWKLFVAFALVIAVGVVTLWVVIGLAAPRFFDLQMGGMMGSSSGGM